MSLKARLSLLMVALVATSVVGLSVLEFNGLVSAWVAHAVERSTTTANLVKIYIIQRTGDLRVAPNVAPTPAELERLWTHAIESDTDLRDMLASTLALTTGIGEILVAGKDGRILISTNAARIGRVMAPRLDMRTLLSRGSLERFLAIQGGRIDYETHVSLGRQDEGKALFTIQVLTSTALLRDAIMPPVYRMLLISLGALLIATVLTWWASQLALRPLAALGERIDLIARGEAEPAAPRAGGASEVVVVEEKLRLLGEQVRGAQLGASRLRGSVEQMLARLEDIILLVGEDGLVLMCAQPAEQLLGRPGAEILGQSWRVIFPPSTQVGRMLEVAIAERRQLMDRPVVWGPSDAPLQLLLSLEYLPEGPSAAGGGFVIRLRDLEGRQMLASQLNLVTRLTAINRLTGGVAHEIKNPLNSITIRLELLRTQLREVPEAEPELNVISEEITRLDRVVRTFLDFAKPVELQAVDLDFVQLTEGILTLVRPEAESIGIKIEFLPRVAPVTIHGDGDLLRQAVLNVVRNALEATPQGGRIGVTLVSGAREAVLSVADSGPGIPTDARDRVFQLYYSTKEGGSGIGLAMAYRAFQLHGGSIEIDSSPTGGALVRMKLPAAAAGSKPGTVA